ncbi:cytochrome C oxidase subunit IV family protein [Tautonia marina]|uniref:cytochrome C oxidase subunit IV family protein n=1 Tax=Tautonia marina TaxID=2653855 RepID=UPI0012607859|nr:cytochrome C oxidase subunit IV family protein [Tautonia marina]
MDPTGTPSTIVVSQTEQTSHVKVYLRVFLALLVLTMAEYFYAKALAGASAWLLIGGLMVIAIVKAGLVGLFFMHLLFEGRWKYLVLLPTTFLATVTVLGLVPDMALPPGEPDPNPAAPIAASPEQP